MSNGAGASRAPTLASRSPGGGDLVALWEVKLPDGLHRVEFEHGTTSGKRIIRLDGKEIKRKSYMFKLVGPEKFSIAGKPCTVHIEAAQGMRYAYKLEVDGQTYDRYIETTAKDFKIWNLVVDGERHEITLDGQTLDVRLNGELMETSSEFTDYGSESSFHIGSHRIALRISTAQYERKGLHAELLVDNGDTPIPPDGEPPSCKQE